jgi:DNA transformation protein and related proteins
MTPETLIATLTTRLAPLGAFRARAMFGCHGLYLDDVMFGLIGQNRLYLKTDAETRPAFAKAKSTPFLYHGATRTIPMSYWLCPPAVLKDPKKLRDWVRAACEAGRRSRAAKPQRKKRATSAL